MKVLSIFWGVHIVVVAAVLFELGPPFFVVEAAKDTEQNPNKSRSSSSSSATMKDSSPSRLRRTTQVLQVAIIEESDRKKQQQLKEISSNNHYDNGKIVHNKPGSNSDERRETSRHLLQASKITAMNHYQAVKEENVLMNVNEMVRMFERDDRGDRGYYYSMSMEPVSSVRSHVESDVLFSTVSTQ